MSGVLAAIAIVNGLLPLIQQGIDLIEKANSEGRDVSPEELAALRAKTDSEYSRVTKMLEEAEAKDG